ncbi:poly-gamma-glutamate synthesis protein (capsule biosynthesis protein) [Pseudomonas delhiensis]|uniref:Poly-gamma-glutamate synthesis protein (Capsule biosynthesis protein) n=1 Tax=Pseudomonas delhiensis TaxID=366289 RepID=A0A239E9L1_9PSED|nr:CapA family protein [Pseudomonas delhiensis]SDI32720.1 poly-gamma-glutamate synthesis protein (capsule biosynthesis protein) [Pseudomonas delhiensis]SNS41307.1 poly-gamma-glutamate synthesis protein (capsule biosynthesis protein) [Pseudomonas delhiensis]
MTEYLIEDLQEIVERLKAHLEENLEEVIATLKDVASGELPIIETVTPEEAEIFKRLCGWVVGLDLQRILIKVERELIGASTESQRVALGNLLKDPELSKHTPLSSENIDQRAMSRQAVMLMSYIFYEEFHYPQAGAGTYDIANDPFEKLKWVYRYWLNQLEVAEKGSGLESLFASQNLDRFTIESPPETRFVTITCAGDLLAVDALKPENATHLFDGITDFYSNADIVSANLESTVDKNSPIGRYQEPGQPARMNTSEEMFQKFCSEAKINFFSTATNHAMDWGPDGVHATLNVLKNSGALYAGTAASQAEQDEIVIFEKNGVRIALLAFTMDLNGYSTPPDQPYLVNEIRFNDVNPGPNYSLLKKQVQMARDRGANWIIAYCHWGWEFEMYPHVNIRQAAHDILGCGVDTILGNHAHVSQPAEIINDKLVIYSFGDFVSYHPESRNSKLSYIVKFEILQYNTETSLLRGLKALPIYIVNEDLGGGDFNCRIVKFHDVLNNPDAYGLTDIEKNQLPHLRDKVWKEILSPLSSLTQHSASN